AFAEAGDYETAQQIIRKKPSILLILSGIEEDIYAIKYAISLAKRINGILNVFAKKEVFKNYMQQLKGGGVYYEILEFENFSEKKMKAQLEKADLIIMADEKLIEEIRFSVVPLVFVQPSKNLIGG
ncbi:MAG: hypothetical protein ACP5KH_04640, partial [Thermodesulfovibrio sp.]